MQELISIDYHELMWEFANKFLLNEPLYCYHDLCIPIGIYTNPIKYKTNYEWDINKGDLFYWIEELSASPIFISDNKLINNLMDYLYEHKSECDEIAHDLENEIKKFNNKIKEVKNKEKLKYALDTYKAPKGSKSVTYKGTTYQSKKQCCVLNDISESDLKHYLLNNEQ